MAYLCCFDNKLTVDDSNIFSSENYSAKWKVMYLYSNYNSLITETNINYEKIKPDRRLIFNLNTIMV